MFGKADVRMIVKDYLRTLGWPRRLSLVLLVYNAPCCLAGLLVWLGFRVGVAGANILIVITGVVMVASIWYLSWSVRRAPGVAPKEARELCSTATYSLLISLVAFVVLIVEVALLDFPSLKFFRLAAFLTYALYAHLLASVLTFIGPRLIATKTLPRTGPAT